MKLPLATLLTSTVAAIETKLTILHINDHHSHLSESSAGYVNIRDDNIPASVSASNGSTKDLRVYYGGFPRLVTAMNELHLEASSNGRDVLRLHAGDAITGTTYFTLFEGDADAELMSHLCLDAFTLGNHEFDKGDAGLAKFLKAMKTSADSFTDCPQMPAVLGANIVPHDQSSLLATDVPDIESSKIFTTSNGEKIGVIGIDIAKKTMNSSQPDAGTLVLDERETAQVEIDILTAQGVNKIVLLTHIGFTNDQAWMAQLNGVDVVVGGDSHSLLGDDSTSFFGSIVGNYATEITQENGSKVCVVQAWDYAKLIGNLEIDFDANGNVISCGGTPVFPLNPDTVTVRDASPRYNLSPDDASLVMDELFTLSQGQARPFAEDTAAADALAVFTSEVEILSETIVANVSETIGLEEGGWDSGSCDLVAQGFLLNPLSTADIAIQNRGGCRADIEEGNFTVNDAYTLLPFSNTMFNLVMTGAQIKQVLEDAINYYLDPSGSWGAYPRSSGLRFDVNEAKAFGHRVSNLEVNPKLAGSWNPINMDERYTVVTNNYIATPRDGYYEFGNVPEEDKLDTYVEYAQSFIEYAESIDSLEPIPDDARSTQNWSNELQPTPSPTELTSGAKQVGVSFFLVSFLATTASTLLF